jgi:uncharacterized protein (TIGR03435 family)
MRKGLSTALSFVLVFSDGTVNPSRALSGQSPHSQADHRGSEASQPFTYDVASIRESESTPALRQHLHNPIHVGSLDAVLRLSQLVGEALGVNFRYQLAGGPDWLDRQNFTIHARADAEVDRRLALLTDEQAKEGKRRMLLQLLQDRFGLTYHYEQRPGLTYFLTVIKESPNLRPKSEPSTDSGIASGGVPTDISLTGHDASMSQFVGLMSYYLKAPVVDQTGLKGVYDFKVHFNGRPDLLGDDIDPGPLPEQALAEQLGLRLVRGKAPVQTVVIDSVNKPTTN